MTSSNCALCFYYRLERQTLLRCKSTRSRSLWSCLVPSSEVCCFFFLIQQCTANGLSYETITQDGSGVITLEIFFSGFPRMVGLSFFPNLRHLTVVGQDLTKIEDLECCPLLQELWVAECHLTVSLLPMCCYSLQNIYSSAKK